MKELTKVSGSHYEYVNVMLLVGLIEIFLTYKIETFKTTFTNNSRKQFIN